MALEACTSCCSGSRMSQSSARTFSRPGEVPLLLHRLGRHVLAHQVGEAALAQRRDLGAQVGRVHDVVALLVDHLALVVGDVVVLQQLLADVEVAAFDLALRALDAARDDAGLDGLAVGHLEAVHDRLDPVAREDAHQRVVQAQVEARGARVALAARAAAQLVVDAARLVPLGGDDAQAALLHHHARGPSPRPRAGLAIFCCLAPASRLSSASTASTAFSTLPPSTMSVPRPAMLVAMVIIFGRPAWATMSASRACCLALSTWCGSLPCPAAGR